MRIYELLESVKIIDAEPTSGLWFMHQSDKKLLKLKPMSYEELSDARGQQYPIKNRKDGELVYKSLTNNPENMSFLYATIVGYNQFDEPLSYPGYTYYFKLSNEQIEQCVFTIIDKQEWMEPQLGKTGLKHAIQLWNKFNSKFELTTKRGVGIVNPRIEVVIPFQVMPQLMIPQIEDR